jgi:5'-nucleotidase (lipoprotein e(P4) family)
MIFIAQFARTVRVATLGAGLLIFLVILGAAGATAQTPQNDLLNATLWMQRAVEYKANSLGAFALAKIRLEQALADENWTGAPAEQKDAYQKFPPAVVLDLDETLIDNSRFQAWMALNDKTFTPEVWTKFVNAQVTEAIPGAVEFTKFAEAKGVKVFYISNRTAEEEASTRANMERLGFPMGGNVDTFLMTKKRPDWTSTKGTRRAFVAKDYRVLLNLGDNLGDFVDAYRTSEADRLKVFEDNRDRWGREWIMLANPAYGSFESAPFGHDYKKSPDEQRKAKREALQSWSGP